MKTITKILSVKGVSPTIQHTNKMLIKRTTLTFTLVLARPTETAIFDMVPQSILGIARIFRLFEAGIVLKDSRCADMVIIQNLQGDVALDPKIPAKERDVDDWEKYPF